MGILEIQILNMVKKGSSHGVTEGGGGIGGINGVWRRPPKLFERSKRAQLKWWGGLFFWRLSPLSHLRRIWSSFLWSPINLWSRLCCRWDRFKCPPHYSSSISSSLTAFNPPISASSSCEYRATFSAEAESSQLKLISSPPLTFLMFSK